MNPKKIILCPNPNRDQGMKTTRAAEEILHLDTLPDCVEGEIPPYEALLPMARPIVRLQGIYRDRIPPEKEDPIL